MLPANLLQDMRAYSPETVTSKAEEDINEPETITGKLDTFKGEYCPARGVFTLAADNLQDFADARKTLRH